LSYPGSDKKGMMKIRRQNVSGEEGENRGKKNVKGRVRGNYEEK
jgi:hypothetical protein